MTIIATPTTNTKLLSWVSEWAEVLEPDDIYWCDGSDEEYQRLADQLVASGTFTKLDENQLPNSYLALSDPADVARVDEQLKDGVYPVPADAHRLHRKREAEAEAEA